MSRRWRARERKRKRERGEEKGAILLSSTTHLHAKPGQSHPSARRSLGRRLPRARGGPRERKKERKSVFSSVAQVANSATLKEEGGKEKKGPPFTSASRFVRTATEYTVFPPCDHPSARRPKEKKKGRRTVYPSCTHVTRRKVASAIQHVRSTPVVGRLVGLEGRNGRDKPATLHR